MYIYIIVYTDYCIDTIFSAGRVEEEGGEEGGGGGGGKYA